MMRNKVVLTKHSDFTSSLGRKNMAKLKLHFLKKPENMIKNQIYKQGFY